MATGTVKFFNAHPGFGFIVPTMAARMCSSTFPPSSVPVCTIVTRARSSYDVQADPRSGKSAAANLQAV